MTLLELSPVASKRTIIQTLVWLSGCVKASQIKELSKFFGQQLRRDTGPESDYRRVIFLEREMLA